MSDLNEEFLNDDNDGDYPDLGDVDEEALLQDDEETDVLELAVEEEELGETLDESKLTTTTETEEDRGHRQDKFATERKNVATPESYIETTSNTTNINRQFQRSNSRRGGQSNKSWQNRNRPTYGQQNDMRPNNNINNYGRNKTVLINPRFQGIVSNAWDHNMQGQPQQMDPNPWDIGKMPVHQNQLPMHMPMYNQQPHMQNPQVPYWDGQGQNYTPYEQMPNQYAPQDNERLVYQPPMNPYAYQNQPVAPPPHYQHYQNFGDQGPPGCYVEQYPPPVPFDNRNSFDDGRLQQQQPFHQKRRVMGNFQQQNKRRFFVSQQNQTKMKPRPPHMKPGGRQTVVKEVMVTNVAKAQLEEDDDPQTRDLRQKIEEQRRKREEILRWKENRRKQGQQQQGYQPFKPVNQAVNQHNLTTIPTQPMPMHKNLPGLKPNKGRSPNILVTNGRRLTPLQKSGMAKLRAEQRNTVNTPERVVKIMDPPERIVNVKVESGDPSEPLDEEQLSSFLADRKILAKDESLMSTRTVFIKNISSSTTDKTILTICRTIGDVQMWR